MPYALVLFFHLGGAVVTFMGVGTLFFSTVALRRARRTEEVLSLAWIFEMGTMLGFAGILVVAASGLYLAWTVWGLGRSWVLVAIAASVLMSPVWPVIVVPRIERVIHEARSSPAGPVSPALAAHLNDPVAKLGALAVIGVLVGLVFLMTLKPPLTGSIAAMLVSIAVCLLLGLPSIGKAVGGAVTAMVELERKNNPLYRS